MAVQDDYLARCGRAIDELKSSDFVHVEKAELRPTTLDVLRDPDWVFGDIAERTGLTLAPGVREYFFAADRVQVFWYSMSEPDLRGEFCLNHLHWALLRGEVPQDAFGTISRDPVKMEVLGQLRFLDQEPMAGTARLTALRITPGGDDPQVWLYDMNHERLELLDLDYAGYLENLLITKGAYQWQYLFAEVDFKEPEFHDTARHLSEVLRVFPEMFPGHDYAPLQERLEARL
ncbi:hypothetical protein DMB42_05570 [Nonomuraea sp. WAC 01424]|uniref:hypothetical protein n=1 Tax=Nonomuraea sp. WAC 01424 TaxID=2203200 RepID=UPI000F79E3A0|nr:hypothetical protein [Nonomuraea sp. WAC 01424]RSN14036.1 hypothetical protein DMB42_05570 [Nonomuraea sp. WAC 01424]